jgi:hypothetical protein
MYDLTIQPACLTKHRAFRPTFSPIWWSLSLNELLLLLLLVVASSAVVDEAMSMEVRETLKLWSFSHQFNSLQSSMASAAAPATTVNDDFYLRYYTGHQGGTRQESTRERKKEG